MNILYDRNMTLGEALFPRLGRAVPVEGRTLSQSDLAGCDLLFVRSTCRLGRDLLEGTPVRFVGSGVAGTDHIDFEALLALGIPVVSAPGCNAESVADYVVAALLHLARRQGRSWRGTTLGIVGVGHVGSFVKTFAEEALGMKTLCCDPPRKETGDPAAQDFLTFEEILPRVDVLTFHTPLTDDGPYPTRRLFDDAAAEKLKPGATLLNFARGPICDNALLLRLLEEGRLADAAIDCWEGEPHISPALAARAALATPHIAGHAYEGRANGTLAVYRAACDFLGRPAGDTPPFPPAPIPELALDCRGRALDDLLAEAVLATCDICGDSRRFKADPSAFDAQRRTVPHRRLFSGTTLRLAGAAPETAAAFQALGFVCLPDGERGETP